MMEVVVTTGAIRRAKLQPNRHHQQTITRLFYRPDALPVAQPTVCQSTEGKNDTFVKYLFINSCMSCSSSCHHHLHHAYI